MPASSPPESPQAQQNPLLQSFNAWKARTPFVTRTLTISLVVMYLLSFFIRWEYYLSNIPYYTVQYFQLFRLITSPFAGNSIFTLLLVLITFPAIGLKLETSMGSSSYLSLLGLTTLVVNIGFVLIAYTAYFFMGMVYGYGRDVDTPYTHSSDGASQDNTGVTSGSAVGGGVHHGVGLDTYSTSPLTWVCMDFWTVLFALLTLDCMSTPDTPRRLLCIPYDIPSKYLPLVLYALVCVLSGSLYTSYLISMGMGYAVCMGYMDRCRPSSQYLAGLEAEGGWLRGLSRNEG
ncbi:hypothetical protein EON63_15595 [archaeon]|nr:MAG: hypothetical protein EON63_15595 [archaeon]